MSVEWDDLIPSTVFTRIKTEFSSVLKTKYKITNDNFSTAGSSDTPAVFPFINIQLLSASELGEDLEGDKINAARFGFQIDVTDNKSQQRAKEVMAEVKRIMVSNMRFRAKEMPTFDNSKDTHRATARFKRVIADGDIL